MAAQNGVSQAFAGVTTVPPQSVHQSIRAQVDAALQGVKDGKTMAILNVKTQVGMNLAVAHRETIRDDVPIIGGGEWEVVAWVGKSGWQAPLEQGVSIAFSR